MSISHLAVIKKIVVGGRVFFERLKMVFRHPAVIKKTRGFFDREFLNYNLLSVSILLGLIHLVSLVRGQMNSNGLQGNLTKDCNFFLLNLLLQ